MEDRVVGGSHVACEPFDGGTLQWAVRRHSWQLPSDPPGTWVDFYRMRVLARKSKLLYNRLIDLCDIARRNVKSRRGRELLYNVLFAQLGDSEVLHDGFGLRKDGADVMHDFVVRTKVLFKTVNKVVELAILEHNFISSEVN